MPAKSNQAQGRKLQLPGISPAGEQSRRSSGLPTTAYCGIPSLQPPFCRGCKKRTGTGLFFLMQAVENYELGRGAFT